MVSRLALPVRLESLTYVAIPSPTRTLSLTLATAASRASVELSMTDARCSLIAAGASRQRAANSEGPFAMSSSLRSAPPVCLVIRWPRSVAASSGPAQLLRRLVEDHLPATWGVEIREQSEMLDAVPHQLIETALLLPKTSAATVSDAIADGIHRFSAGQITIIPRL